MTETTYTPEQQAQNRKKWVEALRSGDYPQTRGRLAGSTGFCCLGVGCEVAKSEGVITHYCKGGSGAPLEVQDFFGIDDAGSLLRSVDGESSLVALNDLELWSFGQIADLIEADDSPLAVDTVDE